MPVRIAAVALAASLLFTGCSTPGDRGALVGSPGSGAPALHGLAASSKYIKHVVIIVQENRSFNNVFAGFPGADAPTSGNLNGTQVPLHRVEINSIYDPGHAWVYSLAAFDHGKMDRFDLNRVIDVPTGGGKPAGRFAYAFLDRTQVAPYWEMARRYVLADRMFPTEFGGSFTAHLDLIAGTTSLTPKLAEVDRPNDSLWGCDAPAGTISSTIVPGGQPNANGPFPCFTQFRTMADTLDAANVSWKYYAPAVESSDGSGGIWSEFDSISNVRYGPDWQKNVVSPETTVLDDASSGRLPAVSWVVPNFANSDHAGNDSDTGPSWVSSVVNAIGNSPAWNSTAIVVLWDDYGGWYDDAVPPQLDYRGLGLRVPCVIISPYAKAHYVSHTLYEYGSILKFAEETFGLPRLGPTWAGYTDSRANSIADSFDFTKPPRAFVPIPAKYSPAAIRAVSPSRVAPDSE